MKICKICCVIIIVLSSFICNAQYRFSGNVENDSLHSTAYLSIIEDYRKISGVHEEQIISKVKINTNFFEFKGNNLDVKNKIYRIHIDNCNDYELDANHFNGKCDASREIIFIANNRDTVSLPISLDNQIFCAIESNNKHANALFQIDSLKEQMRYDYGNYRSEANRKLNNKKWFAKLQEFGEQQDEPLAELYIYNFLSNRSSDLYSYYLKDINSNEYYDGLLDRLKSKYPKSLYVGQYENEITSDRFISSSSKSNIFLWKYLAYGLLLLSILGNVLLLFKLKRIKKKQKESLTDQLTQQEQKILDLILEGKTNKEIATEVFVSLSTVKTHINNLYKKLDVATREQVKLLFDK
ncbi:MAG: helix-turn-helix transcriptional regulator [Flavobacteriaceae bacterium]|nr:helix-turn-helix transcriptional regulator [Flavobacteriaceae bacterium]